MRICPQCRRSFGEQDFRACPFDGASLAEETAQPADPMLGRILDGRFRIVETIGQGGMGAVYKAVHTQMDRLCAIKLLSPAATDRASAIARFRREARMTSRIDSPNAVTIYDFGEAEPGLLYLVMEYVEGESLAQLLTREHALTIERAVRITNQIARALAAAHSLGIVHRDLKPDNIMLTRKRGENEVVKVLDFGIAKSVTDGGDDHLTQTGFLLGTPPYMSPEQVLGESIDSRSDVYSLAIIVYQMLSGELPFAGESMRALMLSRVNKEPRPLRDAAPSLPAAIEQVVMSGLSRDPELRIADVQNFAAKLSAASVAYDSSGVALPTMIEGLSGKSGASARLEATSLAPAEMAAADNEPPSSPSGTLPSPALMAPTVEASATMHAPQAPLSHDDGNAASRQSSLPATPSPARATRQSQLMPFIIVAASVILIAGGLGVGGIYIYLRARRAQPPVASDQPAPQTSQGETERKTGAAPNGVEQAAAAHYREGKSQQEQAASLASAGAAAAAAAKNEQAVAEYRKALKSQPTFPEARENLGVALYDLGRADEAVTEYEIAIRQYPKPTSQVLTNYGMALLAMKRFKEADDAFAQALVLQPTDTDLHYYRGFALHYAGDRTSSREAFARYLKASPQGSYAKDVKDILERRAAPSLKPGGQ